MTVITRGTRIYAGSEGPGSKVYHGTNLVWPTNSRVHFEQFSTHPFSVLRDPEDYYGHNIFLLNHDWDGQVLAGYGSINENVAPIHITSMDYDTGEWVEPAFIEANCYGIQRSYAVDGKIVLPAMDGPADYIVGDPVGGWSNVTISPTTTILPFSHPLGAADLDGYLWIGGQGKQSTSAVWRTPLNDLTGAGGELVYTLQPPGTTTNRVSFFFAHAGKVWYQRVLAQDGPSGSRLHYWDEDLYTFVDTGINYGNGNGVTPVLWNGEMWTAQGSVYPGTIDSFDGTSFTTHVSNTSYDGTGVSRLSVGEDNALYGVGTGGNGKIWRTTDGDEWVQIGTVASAVSIRQKGDYVYVGDNADTVWRGELGIWGGP